MDARGFEKGAMEGKPGEVRSLDSKTDLAFAASEYLSTIAARGYSKSTLKSRRWILREFVAYAKKNGITDARHIAGDFLREYISHVSRLSARRGGGGDRYSPGMVEHVAGVLRVFFRHLSKGGLLLVDPGRMLSKIRCERRPPVPLSPVAVERVLALPDTATREGLRDRAILEVFYGTGIRRAELSALRVEDLRAESGTLFVRQGKGRKDRVLPVGERALFWVNRYLSEVRPVYLGRADKKSDAGKYLFLTRRGLRLEPRALTSIAAKYLRRAGVERGSCHIFRHTCATEMLSNGADIVHIQELLGHERASASQIYTHVSPERLREKYMRSHPAVFGELPASGAISARAVRFVRMAPRRGGFPEHHLCRRKFNLRTPMERTIGGYLEDRGLELTKRSIESFRFYLYNFAEWCARRGTESVGSLSIALLEDYQRHLSKRKKRDGDTISIKTQRYEMESVCTFVRWCHGRGLVLSDPSAAIELPRTGRSLAAEYLTREAMDRVLCLPDTSRPYGIRDRAVLEILYATGIRAGELCALRLRDADFDRDSLRVSVSKHGLERVIPVSPRAMKWLYRYVHEIRDRFVKEETERLFLVDTGRPFDRLALRKCCRRYLRLSGIEKGSIHIFRHSCATHMVENGADLRTVQEFLGHRWIGSTKVYVHISIQNLKKVHAMTHPGERRFLERLRMTEEEREADGAKMLERETTEVKIRRHAGLREKTSGEKGESAGEGGNVAGREALP